MKKNHLIRLGQFVLLLMAITSLVSCSETVENVVDSDLNSQNSTAEVINLYNAIMSNSIGWGENHIKAQMKGGLIFLKMI